MFEWRHGGNDVRIIGSWDQWQSRIPMQKRQDGVHALVQELPPGYYSYKYVIDGQWFVAED
jgi:5'-AMP-activated protein kinase regulatory beta subunit